MDSGVLYRQIMTEDKTIDGNLKSVITEFLEEYYDKEIRDLANEEEANIKLNYSLIEEFNEDMAENLSTSPEFWIKNAEKAIEDYDDNLDIEFPRILFTEYDNYAPSIRDLRDEHIGKLVRVSGIVSKTTGILPKADVVAFECKRCGSFTRIKQPLDPKLEYPTVCSGEDCNNRSEQAFRINVNQSDKINFKKIEIQEPPENTKGGQTPESETFTAKGEIATNVTAGDNVDAIGVYRGSSQGDTSILRTYIHGNNIITEGQETEDIDIAEEEKEEIIELSNDPDIYTKLRESTAPSLYGLEKEKDAIVYQLFSGVRKTKMDGNIRGDIHVLLCGDPGTGKSVKFSTYITLDGGIRKTIGEFVEENLTNPTKDEDGDYIQKLDDNIKVMAMDKDGEIEPRNVEAVWKKQVENCYKVTLDDGRTIETSGTHPLFETDGDAHIDQVKVKDIDDGQFIAVPRSISYDGNLELNVNTDNIDESKIDIPNEWSEELAAFMGLIVGEGHINDKEISITNQDEELLDIAENGFELFGINSYQKVWSENSNAYKIVKGSTNLSSYFNELDSKFINKSHDKRIPTCLYSTPENIRKAFIRAYVDGEAYVSEKNRELEVPSVSKELLQDLQQLLDTFGISSRINEKVQDLSYNNIKDYKSYRLRIYGDAFRKYVDEIGFYSNRKIEQAELMKNSRVGNTNVDVIPNVGSVIKETRELLGMHQSDFSVPRTTVLGLEQGGKNPSKKTLQDIVVDMVDRLHVVKDVDYSRESADMETVDKMRSVLGMNQETIATDGAGLTKGGYRYHLTNNTNDVTERSLELFDYVSECLDEQYHEVHENLIRLESLAWGDIRWEKVESVEQVDYDSEWMYDLQVEGTHNYIANGIMSHNSQLLRYASELSPRGIMTNGKGASSAGLTAAAVRDAEFGGEDKWTLKAGALVLADKGIACVDELDKMDASDRSAMHEGLEQQTISVSKAGINATLKSRCTLLGAANPKEGRWNEYDPIAGQIDLEPALISRFDLIFAPTDKQDEKWDSQLADHILMTNHRGEQLEAGIQPDDSSEEVVPDISPELFRKYVAYAQKHCTPVLNDEAREILKEFYVDIRKQGGEEGTISITARKIEALVRLTEAAARIQLEDEANKNHAQRAVNIIQSSLEEVGYDEKNGRYDVDMTENSQSTSQRDRRRLLREAIEDNEDEGDKGAPKKLIMEIMVEIHEFEEETVEHDLMKLCRDGKELYEPKKNEYAVM